MLAVTNHPKVPPVVAIATVEDDEHLIEMWLSDKSENTKDAYRRDANYFLAFLDGKPLQRITLNDFQAYRKALTSQGWAASTIHRRLNAVRSLLTYGHRIGVLAVNVAASERLSKPKDTTSQRILPESVILKILHGYRGSDRNRVILFFLYGAGCRASELTSLTWADCQEEDNGTARITIHGKGNKTRVILITADVWQMVKALKGDRPLNSPVFVSRNGNALSRTQIHRIVKAAARQAGVEQNVSAHWFRHAHASHSLKRGAPLDLVQQSLGHSSLDTTKIYLHASPDDSSGLYLGI